MIVKRVYKCEYCYLQNARPCYECSACMSGDDHFRPAKPEKKQMTNADRTRAMSDEELAELLANETYRIAKPCFDAFGYGLEKQVIYAKRLEWLQQPAEGE